MVRPSAPGHRDDAVGFGASGCPRVMGKRQAFGAPGRPTTATAAAASATVAAIPTDPESAHESPFELELSTLPTIRDFSHIAWACPVRRPSDLSFSMVKPSFPRARSRGAGVAAGPSRRHPPTGSVAQQAAGGDSVSRGRRDHQHRQQHAHGGARGALTAGDLLPAVPIARGSAHGFGGACRMGVHDRRRHPPFSEPGSACGPSTDRWAAPVAAFEDDAFRLHVHDEGADIEHAASDVLLVSKSDGPVRSGDQGHADRGRAHRGARLVHPNAVRLRRLFRRIVVFRIGRHRPGRMIHGAVSRFAAHRSGRGLLTRKVITFLWVDHL